MNFNNDLSFIINANKENISINGQQTIAVSEQEQIIQDNLAKKRVRQDLLIEQKRKRKELLLQQEMEEEKEKKKKQDAMLKLEYELSL